MKTHLFLDSSLYLQFGLLDENFKWIDHILIETTKSSNILHSELNRMMEKNRVSFDDIDTVFSVSGPGSYTGIRLVEGISQILTWQGKEVLSIYHFEIPKIVGFSSGVWMSEAFKGEAFLYQWNMNKEKKELLPKTLLSDFDEENLFSHRTDFGSFPTTSTSAMVFENPSKIFSYMLNNKTVREPYYYRELESEFKVTQA